MHTLIKYHAYFINVIHEMRCVFRYYCIVNYMVSFHYMIQKR